MRRLFFLSFTFFLTFSIWAQDSTISIKANGRNKMIVRNVAWLTPVKRHTKINGLALGLFAGSFENKDSIKINGINISYCPLVSEFLAAEFLIRTPFKKIISDKDTSLDKSEEKDTVGIKTSSNGLCISGVNFFQKSNGVMLNAYFSINEYMNGVEISGLMNFHQSFKGVMIAGIINSSERGNGIQIGLINHCRKGNVVQIGLINRIGNRTLPLINFGFSRRKRR